MIGLIWAQTPDGVIGADNAIPWHLPEDMAHFKAVTLGHPVIMGRKTWDSLPPRFRPLPGRRNIVVTRQANWSAPGAERADSVERAIALVDDGWVIGGSEIYSAAMPFADRLVVTVVDLDVDGDSHAPTVGPQWSATDEGDWLLSESTGTRYRFRRFERN